MSNEGFAGNTSSFELHQELALLPFTDIAFDKDALMFWGRHNEQTHILLNKSCYSEDAEFLLVYNKYKHLWVSRLGQYSVKKVLWPYVSYLIVDELLKTCKCHVKNGKYALFVRGVLKLLKYRFFWIKTVLFMPKKIVKLFKMFINKLNYG